VLEILPVVLSSGWRAMLSFPKLCFED